jgi:hypothetical protein
MRHAMEDEMSQSWEGLVRLQNADGTSETRPVEIDGAPGDWRLDHVHAYVVNVKAAFDQKAPGVPAPQIARVRQTEDGLILDVQTDRGIASTEPLVLSEAVTKEVLATFQQSAPKAD